MKKIILAVFCLLIFSGCFSDWQGDGTGTIIINLGVGTGARSLWPDDHENIVEKLVYDIVLTSVGSDDIEYFKIQNELRVSVKAGDWNVKLTAYFPDVGPGIPYAIGTRPVFVIAGRNNDVDVKMDPMFCGVCKDYPCTCQAVECLCKDGENCICGDDCECDCDCCLFGCDECGECEECNPECEHAFPDEWDTITDPTCTEQGSEENKCDKCGASHEDSPRVIEKLQHNYPTNWTTIKPSTCAEAGSEEKKCPDCGTHAANSPRMIGQLQHNFPTNW
ncbi:MAG: hypothetical protein FWD13_11980, partial [Treponema sp.]|nr:hypothetical protein [Treponema sp.]